MKLYLSILLASLAFNSYGASQGNKKQVYQKHQIFMVPELLANIASQCSSLEELDNVVSKLVVLGNNRQGQIYNNGLSLIALYFKNQLGEGFDEAKFLSEADNLTSESYLKYIKPMMHYIIDKNLHALHTLLLHVIFRGDLTIIPKWFMPIVKYGEIKVVNHQKPDWSGYPRLISEVQFIEISKDSSFFIIRFDNSRIEIRDKNGKLLGKIKEPNNTACISEDSNTIITYSYDNICIWDRNGKLLNRSENIRNINYFTYNNGTIKIADYRNGRYGILDENGEVLGYFDNPSPRYSFSFDISSNNNFIVIAGGYHVKVLDINGNILHSKKCDKYVSHVSFSRDNKFICVGFKGGHVHIYDADFGLSYLRININPINIQGYVYVSSIDINNNVIAVGYNHGSAIYTISGKLLDFHEMGNRQGPVLMKISEDGSFIVVEEFLGILRVLSRPTLEKSEHSKCSVM